MMGHEAGVKLRMIERWKINLIQGTVSVKTREAQGETRLAMQGIIKAKIQETASRSMSKAMYRLIQGGVRACVFRWRTHAGEEKFSPEALRQIKEAQDRAKHLAKRIQELKEANEGGSRLQDNPDSNWLFPRSPPKSPLEAEETPLFDGRNSIETM